MFKVCRLIISWCYVNRELSVVDSWSSQCTYDNLRSKRSFIINITLVKYLFTLRYTNMTPQRYNRLNKVLSQRQPDITVVLENVFDPHNVSAVMRTCDAVGIQDVYILNNRIPPHKKWGYRSSSTAAKWLTIHQFTDAEKCFEEIRNRYTKSIYDPP